MSHLEAIQARLFGLLAERLSLEVSDPEADLIESGMLDSLKFVSLLHELEIHFQVRFSVNDIDMEHFRSIRRIAQFMAQAGNLNQAG